MLSASFAPGTQWSQKATDNEPAGFSDELIGLQRKADDLREDLGEAAFQHLLAQGETLDEAAVCELTLETADRSA
jgi:hypothetical protein